MSRARWRVFIKEGGRYRNAGTINAAVLAGQPLTDSDYCRVRALEVGEDFYDADGDRWLRVR